MRPSAIRKWGSTSRTGTLEDAPGRLRREYFGNNEGQGVAHRLTARFWVDAYLARLRLADIPAFVVAHGDDTGGAVLVKLATLDGRARLFHRSFDLNSGARVWAVLVEGDEPEVDGAVARQRGFDPDLWVIEVEDKAGRHLLDEPGLSG